MTPRKKNQQNPELEKCSLKEGMEGGRCCPVLPGRGPLQVVWCARESGSLWAELMGGDRKLGHQPCQASWVGGNELQKVGMGREERSRKMRGQKLGGEKGKNLMEGLARGRQERKTLGSPSDTEMRREEAAEEVIVAGGRMDHRVTVAGGGRWLWVTV